METPNELCYLSAATSPTSICSLEENLNFYSAPTSPTSEVSHTLSVFKSEPTTPKNSYDHSHFANSFLTDHDFEFETSHHNFDYGSEWSPKSSQPRSQHGDSPPVMAFADELFCDGKVVPLAAPSLKLKLPPGFQRSVAVSVPVPSLPTVAGAEAKSPRSVIGLHLPRQCLWNDDFDPFMAAIENVKEEGDRRNKLERKKGRRARSLSPLRARQPSEYYMGLLKPRSVEEDAGFDSTRPRKSNVSVSARWPSPRKLWGEEDEKSPIHKLGSDLLKEERKNLKGLSEPKGVIFARRVRRVKMDQEKAGKPSVSPAHGPKLEKGKKGWGSRRWLYYTRSNNKRQRIMRLFFRGSSSGKEISSDEENKDLKHQKGVLWKPTFLRRLSFGSNRQSLYAKDKKIVSHVAKMTLIQYRPRLSLCLGYRTRYVE